MTIWKFPIRITEEFDISLPVGAKILHVGLDPNKDACLWVQHDCGSGTEEHTVFVVGTGNPVPDKAKTYIGSFVQTAFVWHVFTT